MSAKSRAIERLRVAAVNEKTPEWAKAQLARRKLAADVEEQLKPQVDAIPFQRRMMAAMAMASMLAASETKA